MHPFVEAQSLVKDFCMILRRFAAFRTRPVLGQSSVPLARASFALLAPAVGLALGALVPMAPARAQMQPCANEFMPLRQAVEKQGDKVKAAVSRKADRAEVCNQIKAFATAEAKYVKYLEVNQSFCGIPPEAVQQLKTGHDRTLKMRTQACAAGPVAGPRGPQVPPGPGLADALGTTRAPVTAGPKSGGSTFDTLTGNVLQR